MDYKELTCSSRSHTAPRTYRIGDAVITNVESPGGPWVGFLTELFEPGDDENFPADQWKRCNIRWLDSFTSSAKEYEDVSFLRRSNVKPENGELFLSDIVDQPSNPVSVIDGRAFLATNPEELEELQENRPAEFREEDLTRLVRYFYQLEKKPMLVRPLHEGELQRW